MHCALQSTVSALGIAGIIARGLSLMSPLPTFYRIWKDGTVGDFSYLSYLTTLLSSMWGIIYGLPKVKKHNTIVIVVSMIGVVFQVGYLGTYIYYSSAYIRRRVTATIIGELGLVAILASSILTQVPAVLLPLTTGIFFVIFVFLTYVAPFTAMNNAIHTKSVQYVPLAPILASLASATLFSAFGACHNDLFLFIASIAGVLFSLIQLIMYCCIYRWQRIEHARSADRGGDGDVVEEDGDPADLPDVVIPLEEEEEEEEEEVEVEDIGVPTEGMDSPDVVIPLEEEVEVDGIGEPTEGMDSLDPVIPHEDMTEVEGTDISIEEEERQEI